MNMSCSIFLKPSFFKNVLSKVFLTFAISLGVTGPSIAQVIYGRSPDLISPVFPPQNNTYKLDNSVDCPTPSLSVGAFGGAGNDWSNNITPYASSNSGINNYGVTVGIQFPFGTSLGSFCEKYVKEKLEFERTKTENQRRNSQLSLIEQCYWLKTSGFDLEQPAFDQAEFSSLRACKNLNLNRKNASIVNPLEPKTDSTPKTDSVILDSKVKPPNSDTSPFSAPATIIQDDRRRN